MLIAIFADIHANLEALQAVLADAQLNGVTEYACLGDIVGYNADPVACLETIRAMNCPVVKGNHDAEASEAASLDNMNPIAAAALQWTRNQLTPEQALWLRRLRMVRQVHDFTIVHSTMDQPASWNYVTNRFEAAGNFTYQFTKLCFHGHTHVPRTYLKVDQNVSELPAESFVLDPSPNHKYFINVGSVGQPRDGDWRASYVIYDTVNHVVHFRRLEYDIRTAQEKIINAGLPDRLAYRLAEGN